MNINVNAEGMRSFFVSIYWSLDIVIIPWSSCVCMPVFDAIYTIQNEFWKCDPLNWFQAIDYDD